MRVIAGVYKGRKLVFPSKEVARPTADRPKEALFSILESLLMRQNLRWAQVRFLDVFAGTGAIGIEALSRGAKAVIFMEKNPLSLKCLKQNLPIESGTTVLRADALYPPQGTACDIVFLDAPYDKNLSEKALVALYKKGWIGDKTFVIVEMDKNENYPFTDWEILDNRLYHRNKFVFLRMKS